MNSVPSLEDFSQQMEQAYHESSTLNFNVRWPILPDKSITNLSQMYLEFIQNLKFRATQQNGYWKLNLTLISEKDAAMECISPEIYISEEWRLMATLKDMIKLAQLAGYKYERQGRDIILPGWNPEESSILRMLRIRKPNPIPPENPNLTTSFSSLTSLTSFSSLCSCISPSLNLNPPFPSFKK